MQFERTTVIWQRVEGALVFGAMLLSFLFGYKLAYPWWALVLIFFAPDLSFLAYLFGKKVGSFAYNFMHSYGLGLVILVLGASSDSYEQFTVGALITGHAGFDRMLGYGLKMPSGFNDTHLGRLGK